MERVPDMSKIIIPLIFNVILNATASLLLKASTRTVVTHGSLVNHIIRIVLQPTFIGGLTCFGLSFVSYWFVLRSASVTVAYPIVVTGSMLLIDTIGTVAFRESLTAAKLLGSSFVLIGLWLLVSQASH